MTDDVNYPGVYLEETQPARAIDGVATTNEGGEGLDEEPPARSIPGVPTTACSQPSESVSVEKAVADDRSGAPAHVSGETGT